MEPQRFAAGLTPLPTAARVTQRRGALRWRIISSVFSLALLVVLVFLVREQWSTGALIAICSLFVASTVFWLGVSIVGLHRAKRDLSTIPEGIAFYFDHAGVEFRYPTQAAIVWEEVTALRLLGRNLGAGPSVAVERDGQIAARVPLSFLDVTPQYIDSAARAYSLGRVHLDAQALDAVL